MSLEAILQTSKEWIEILKESFNYYQIDPITMLLVLGLIVALILVSAIQIYLKIRRQLKPIENDLQTAISTSNQTEALLSDSGNDDDYVVQPCQQRPNDLWQSASKTVEPDALVHDQMKWLHDSAATNEKFVDEILDSWLKQLNNQSEKMVVENGIYVVFFLLEKIKNPKFEQLKESKQIDETIVMQMKFTCDQLIMQVRVASDINTDQNRSAIYDVILDNFSALLKVVGFPNESYYLVRMTERPETKADIRGPLLGSKNKFKPDVIINAVLNIFSCAAYSVSFDKYVDFPKSAAKPKADNSEQPTIERKLLMKIIKADELDLDPSNGHQLQCTVEVDEPIKTFTTSTIRDDIRSPVWNQYFLIHLSEQSKKLYFELSDAQRNKTNDKNPTEIHQNIPHQNTVLGHAFVDLANLRSNPSQTQTLHLISEATKQDLGTLDVEFLLMEHPKSVGPPSPSTPGIVNDNSFALKSNENLVEKQNSLQLQQKPGYPLEYTSRRSTEDSQLQVFNLDDYGEGKQIRASLDLEAPWDQQSTTSSFSEDWEKDIPDIEKLMFMNIDEDAEAAEVVVPSKSNQGDSGYIDQPEQPDVTQEQEINKVSSSSNQDLRQTEEPKHFRKFKTLEQTLSDTGTSSNDFKPFRPLRNFKKRFSFKRRSKSVERQASNRSRQSDLNDYERARSVPGSREPSIAREPLKSNGRESLANMSQGSTGTNYYEDSILILRCDDKNGFSTYYVIPDNVSYKKIKPKLKGKKLHLVKNHLFKAIHKPAANLCQVCHSKLPFNPFKQAYQCIDCGFFCHKNCHGKVERLCPRSSINELSLFKLNGEPIDDISRFNSFSNNYYVANDNNNNRIPRLTVTNAEDLSDVGEEGETTNPHLA